MASWSEDLIGCSVVLYRAVGSTNQAALFGKNSPLKRDDLRVRALPFPTCKPTYKEVKRVHDTVASIEVYGKSLNIIISCAQRIHSLSRLKSLGGRREKNTLRPILIFIKYS